MKSLDTIRIKPKSQNEFNAILSLFQADGYDVAHMKRYGYWMCDDYYWGKSPDSGLISGARKTIGNMITYYESFSDYENSLSPSKAAPEKLPLRFQIETCSPICSEAIQKKFFAAGIYWVCGKRGEVFNVNKPWLFFNYIEGENNITFGPKDDKIPVVYLRRFFTQDFAPRTKIVKINDTYSLKLVGEEVQILERGSIHCSFPKSKLAEIKAALEKKKDSSIIIHTPTPELFNLVADFLVKQGFNNHAAKFANYIITAGSVFISDNKNNYQSSKKIHIEELFATEVEIRLNDIYVAKIGAEVTVGCTTLSREKVLEIIKSLN
jgi:hypothetical protein